MKVNSVELHPDNSSRSVVLSYKDPNNQNPYNVKTVLGLDPQDISRRRYMGAGNTQFSDLFPSKREIVIVVELNPLFADNEDFSTLRDQLYKMIATSRTGIMELQFKDGNDVVAVTSGLISKFETPQFSSSQVAQITIECEEPFLKAPALVQVDVSEFHFSRITLYDNESTAQHGFSFELHFTEPATRFKFRSPHDDAWTFEAIPIGGFLTGDHLWYSSLHTNKYFFIQRGGDLIHLVDAIVQGSMWPILFPGMNVFDIAPAGKIAWDQFAYYPTYWGV